MRIFTWCFLLVSSVVFSQRLSFGVGFESAIVSSYKSAIDQPVQYLYYAPYSPNLDDQTGDDVLYNQVRLAEIDHVRPIINPAAFKGYVSFLSKNALRIDFNVGYVNARSVVFFGFKNLVFDDEFGRDYSPYLWVDEYYEVKDSKIEINHSLMSFELNAEYQLLNRYVLKPFLRLGFKEFFQLFSFYNSEFKSDPPTVESYSYINTKVFQDRLYSEFARSFQNHMLNIGVGGRYYGVEFYLDWSKSVVDNKDSLAEGFSVVSLGLSYDLIYLPLFK